MRYPVKRRLPPELASVARGFAADVENGKTQPATPRDAATVVLLRDGVGGPQAYLLRRVTSMPFAGGMYVFPGGSVDVRDGDHAVVWGGPPPAWWSSRFGTDESLARALVCAAVRETFEESGVLLAGPDETAVVEDTRGDDWERDRQALTGHTLSFAEFLARRGLLLRTDLLRPWAHWITPEFEPRRYDTRFFVAALPTGQRTRDVGGEADRVLWMRPGRALAAYRDGELGMLPPTVATLFELSEAERVAVVLEGAAERRIRPEMPRLVLDDAGAHLLLPGDPGYERGCER